MKRTNNRMWLGLILLISIMIRCTAPSNEDLTRREIIEKQLNYYNGAHIELENLVRRAMNDPKSYEHIETLYWDMGTHLVVLMSCRSRNGYGGLVVTHIRAKTDIYTGKVLEIIEQF